MSVGQGGLILLANKTQYAWRRIHQHSYEMNHWDNQFPQILPPGYCEKVYVEWDSNPRDNDSAGEVTYELENSNGHRFQIWARGRKRSHEGAELGLSIYFDNLATAQQAKGSWINLGWQHDGTVGFFLSGNVHCFNASSITSNAKWMSLVDGERKLTELTIPGTHDTCTYRLNSGILNSTSDDPGETAHLLLPYLSEALGSLLGALGGFLLGLGIRAITLDVIKNITLTQDLDVAAQLERGIRFLDIRLNVGSNDQLRVYHGDVPLVLAFKDVLQTCYDFLNRNPSETIIMSINHEVSSAPDETFDRALNALIGEKPDYWYTGVQVPALEAVRKKIILFRRYRLSSAIDGGKLGIDASYWEDNGRFQHTNGDHVAFDIQDRYKNYHLAVVSDKFYDYVRPWLDRAQKDASANTLFLNFTSGTEGLYPRSIANGAWTPRFRGVNGLLSDWLVARKENRRLGIIPMDFPESPDKGVLPNQLVYRNDLNHYETRLAYGCIYEIHAVQDTGKSLHVQNNSSQPGAAVILHYTTGGRNTQWKLADGRRGSFVLRPQNAPELALDVNGGKTENKTPIIVSGFHDGANQKWKIESAPSDSRYFTLKPLHARQKALELFGVNTDNGTPATLYDSNDSAAQKWAFLMVGFAPNARYSISHRCATRKCLERKAPQGGSPDYMIPQLEPDKSRENAQQHWVLAPVPIEEGWYYIEVPEYPQQVLDIEGAKTDNGTKALVYYKNGGDNQKWRIESCGNGYFALCPKHAPSKVLELSGARTADGTQPSLYSANGSVPQQWILRSI